MQVQEIMSRNVNCCLPSTGIQEVAKIMSDCDCGAIPVVESMSAKRLVGVVTDRDIVCRVVAKGKNLLEATARDCMSTGIATVSTTDSVEECCALMERKQVRRVPVIDETGSCCGIVAQADIAENTSEHETAEVLKEISHQSNGLRGAI